MKISVSQVELARALNNVSRAVPTRTTKPILTNICFTTDGGWLRLFATDVDNMGIVSWVPASIEEEGSTAIPAKLLCQFVGKLQPGPVDFTVTYNGNSSHSIAVKSKRSNATILGFDPVEFPLIPSVDGKAPSIKLDAALLKEMIAEVRNAAGNDIQYPEFTGILVRVRGEILTLAAADRQCLAVRRVQVGQSVPEMDVLIPARILDDFARILPGSGQVELAVTPKGSQAILRADRLQLSARLIERPFPNFEQIIPREWVTRAVVPTAAFTEVAEEVQPFADGGNNIALFSLKGGDGESLDLGKLSLTATAQDLGQTISTIDATVDGPEQEAIFNIRYLMDVLKMIRTPEVAIEVTSGVRPVVIRPIGPIDYTYVITPFMKNAVAQRSADTKTEATAAS